MYDYLKDGYEYTVDGDLRDGRDQLIVKLKNAIRKYDTRNTEEKLLREGNPSLNDAWEQYQILLLLVNQGEIK